MTNEQIKRLREQHKFSKFWDQWTITRDPETGLPKLPEGWFWDVSKADKEEFIVVRLSVPGAGFIASRWLYWDASSHSGSIRTRIWEKARGIIVTELNNGYVSAVFDTVVGQYPPKKLGE